MSDALDDLMPRPKPPQKEEQRPTLVVGPRMSSSAEMEEREKAYLTQSPPFIPFTDAEGNIELNDDEAAYLLHSFGLTPEEYAIINKPMAR